MAKKSRTLPIIIAGLLATGVTFGKVPNADAAFYTTSNIQNNGVEIQLKAENETDRNGLDFEFDTGVLSIDKDKYLDFFTGPSGWNTELYDKTVNGESRVFAKGSAANPFYGSTNNNTKLFSLGFDDSINGLDFYQTVLAGSLTGAFFDLGSESLAIQGVDFYNPINNHNPVPVPGTFLLLGSGLAAMAIMRRRKPEANSNYTLDEELE